MSGIENKVFLALVVALSLGFAWVLSPFVGAILWATLLAIVFSTLFRRLLGPMRKRRNMAAFATMLIIVVMVMIPLAMITASLVQEGTNTYQRFQSGEIDVGRHLQQFRSALPGWALSMLEWFQLTNLAAVQERLSDALASGSRTLAGQALSIGQITADFIVSFFVMLYLLFFLLRDGDEILRHIQRAIPLPADRQSELFGKFTATVRATLKGVVLVAFIQGALGGLIFWLLGIGAPVLWAAVMAVLSLLPVVGSALVWVPVAIYLLVTGSVIQGLVLLAYGALVISLVDNLLRPVLVGQDIEMPSYVVLISTLGGIGVFGVNGFVIGPLIAAMFLVAWEMAVKSRPGPSDDDRQRNTSPPALP